MCDLVTEAEVKNKDEEIFGNGNWSDGYLK